ncbi:hypothetical protein [Gallaecimonas xiamenensis]|uniref:Lipoprotein n=1 Tax=Gallaecimonas xiamenensis 3-C-1 TaxID=745411 RepID=K2J8B6_9GAMM|nr:hypothetical protein [Gallaecimonas xiamenensis]EKE71077.1 hypothetical protein B3C1_13009 [Gallaecimonas xiamenensis 3-C-1]
MKHALLLGLALLLSACSRAPDTGDLHQILSRQFQRQLGPDAVMIRNLEKQDGKAESDQGYLVDVRFDLVFLKSFDDLARQTEDKARNGQWLGVLGQGLSLWQLHMQYGSFQSGDVVQVQQRLELVKTDNGWDLAENWSKP